MGEINRYEAWILTLTDADLDRELSLRTGTLWDVCNEERKRRHSWYLKAGLRRRS